MRCIYPFFAKMKRKINEYSVLHWNVSFFTGRFSTRHYKKLMLDLRSLENQAKENDFLFPVTKLYPCYSDISDWAGSAQSHYFMQDLYVAQRIFQNKPLRHIDIGSRVDGFVAHVASYRKIEIFDIRPLEMQILNVSFVQADIMNMEESLYGVTDSISCLHALEHFGLGRYGDPIRYDGFLIGFKNITAMLKSKGLFYFSVPLGVQRIEFHAHRVFSLRFLLDFISKDFVIKCFSYIDDDGIFYENVEITSSLFDKLNFDFGCAIFELQKK